MTHSDAFNRTAKLLVDRDGMTFGQAESSIAARIMQLTVGFDWTECTGSESAILTAVNSGARAFGEVHVQISRDGPVITGWAKGMKLSEAVARFGGVLVENLSPKHGTVVFGTVDEPIGRFVVYATWSGWSGGVVDKVERRLDERDGNALSGVLAGAVAVSEVFQNGYHGPAAGRRDAGLSLWRPDLPWREPAAQGPALKYLPEAVWIAGLGHLGQAYLWTLGSLKYPSAKKPRLVLQDVDRVTPSNYFTSLLSKQYDDVLKTRVSSRVLEQLGFSTSIIERRFDADTRRQVGEPGLIMSGFDNNAARRAIGSAGFELIVDCGLGSGHDSYLNVLIRSFAKTFDHESTFLGMHEVRTEPQLALGYEEEVSRRIENGENESFARCGVVELAGKAVGAAFVGAFSATLVIAESIRHFHQGMTYGIVRADLRFLGGTMVTEDVGRQYPRVGFIESE